MRWFGGSKRESEGGRSSGSAVPPGQVVTTKMPVMTIGQTPKVSQGVWRLNIAGLVVNPVELDWDQFMAMPQITMDAEFHCVTQWSRMENTWSGVRVRDVIELADASAQAKFAMVHCYDGYTTNMDLETLLADDALLAHSHDGTPLSVEHGAPVRLVLPSLYAWKSAKWLQAIELTEKETPGFWEANGYHMRGDPWREERFRYH
jgi:DMSO/TMAO reductase YedYZ molybdopterin-dependent catalytic subunit